MPLVELDDRALYYREHGAEDQAPEPVIAIMGYGLDQRYWAGQVPAVTASHRLITFDNSGTGRSVGPPSQTIDEMADDTVRLMDHLEIERAVVMGASMGGTIAQRLTLDHPERVSALLLLITWARPIEFMRRQHELGRLLLEAGGPEAVINASLVQMFTPRFFEIGAEAIDRMVRAFFASGGPEPAGADTLAAQLDALDKHDALHELHKITCPTLVVGGKLDMLVPCFASEEIADAIPGAELAIFETGHALMVEEMEAVNNRISKFLGGLI